MYDFQTKNYSFVKIAKKYKELGRKNWAFPLTLYDEGLQGVDPLDEDNLTTDQKIRILKEIRINIYYYLREVVRVPEAGGVTKYEANRGNMALTFCMKNNIDAIEVLPRQNGKTIGAVCNYSHIFNYSTINTNSSFSNKQLDDSELNIKRYKDIVELLPSYLKTHLDPKNDIDNQRKISINSLNNVLTALSTPNDRPSASKLGRGNTTALPW